MLLDMNRFKDVNEEHGHLEGDRVLREVGQALAATVRDQDTVARQGGDEFSVLAPETGTVEVMALASRLQRALSLIRVGRPYAQCQHGLGDLPPGRRHRGGAAARAPTTL